MKDVQAAGETFSSQKITSSTSKPEISSLFSTFEGLFALLDPDPDPADQNQCGSESEILYKSIYMVETILFSPLYRCNCLKT
jgi:hypothetical protein